MIRSLTSCSRVPIISGFGVLLVYSTAGAKERCPLTDVACNSIFEYCKPVGRREATQDVRPLLFCPRSSTGVPLSRTELLQAASCYNLGLHPPPMPCNRATIGLQHSKRCLKCSATYYCQGNMLTVPSALHRGSDTLVIQRLTLFSGSIPYPRSSAP